MWNHWQRVLLYILRRTDREQQCPDHRTLHTEYPNKLMMILFLSLSLLHWRITKQIACSLSHHGTGMSDWLDWSWVFSSLFKYFECRTWEIAWRNAFTANVQHFNQDVNAGCCCCLYNVLFVWPFVTLTHDCYGPGSAYGTLCGGHKCHRVLKLLPNNFARKDSTSTICSSSVLNCVFVCLPYWDERAFRAFALAVGNRWEC